MVSEGIVQTNLTKILLLILVINRWQARAPVPDLRHFRLLVQIYQATTIAIQTLYAGAAVSGTFCRQILQADGASVMASSTKRFRGQLLVLCLRQRHSSAARVGAALCVLLIYRRIEITWFTIGSIETPRLVLSVLIKCDLSNELGTSTLTLFRCWCVLGRFSQVLENRQCFLVAYVEHNVSFIVYLWSTSFYNRILL